MQENLQPITLPLKQEKITRVIMLNLGIALGYFLLARFALLLIIGADSSPPVWPAAGLALLVTSLWGFSVLPGIWFGCLVFNISNISDSSLSLWVSVPLGGLTALGPLFQAAAGASLTFKMIDKIRILGLVKYLVLIGPLCSIISACWCISILTAFDQIQSHEVWHLLRSWWAGDTLGVLVICLVAPILSHVGRRPKYLVPVLVPMFLVLFVTIFFFIRIRIGESEQTYVRFERRAWGFMEAIEKNIEYAQHRVDALKVFWEQTGNQDRQNFEQIAGSLLDDNQIIQALEWIPKVSHNDRAKYEALAQSDGYPHFRFTEKSPKFATLTAADRPVYYPVYYLIPYEGNEAALGYDLYSNRSRRKSLEKACRTRKTTATNGIRLVQEVETQYGVLLFSPVYKETGESCENIQGFILGVLRISDLIESAVSNLNDRDIVLSLEEQTTPSRKTLLHFHGADGQTPSTPQEIQNQLNKTSPLNWEHVIDFGGQTWIFNYRLSYDAFRSHQSWGAWSVLTAGFLGATLLALLMLHHITRTREVESLVAERTKALAETNAALEEEIAQRTKVQSHLEEAKFEAEQAARAKSIFLANMSHEIRTPLNGIIGMSRLLLGSKELPDQVQEFVETIDSSADILLKLINETLDFSKLEAGKMELEIIPFRLHPTIVQVTNLFHAQAKEKGLQLTYSIEPEVPNDLCGDPVRLQQILVNLTNNALKFTHEGRIEIKVTTTSKSDTLAEIDFRVIDTGIGIPINRRDRLFKSFSQVDSSTTRRYGGTGLGLAITKQLVEKMEGSIDVESEEGVGSTFWCKIPFQLPGKSLATAPTSIDKLRQQVTAFTGGESYKVLVVEDNAINQKVAQKILSRMGLSYVMASNGLEALDVLAHERVDLILMDCQMPLMDGYEATRKIRAQERFHALPIIAMTANVSSSDKARCKEAGMNDFLSKPVRQEDLAWSLSHWLDELTPKTIHS